MCRLWNTRNFAIHILRVISYVALPVGTFFFAWFILTALDNSLDFSTFVNALLNLSAMVLFFGPIGIIIFLHPTDVNDGGSNNNNSLNAKIKHYSPHVLIVVILAAVGFVASFWILAFFGLVLGG